MNIWTGLLFLDGSVADVQLARELVGDERAEALPHASAAARDASQAAPTESSARASAH